MVFPNLERYIFNNEILSVLGLTFLVCLAIFKKMIPFQGLKILYMFLGYGIFVLILSLGSISETGLYLSLRTMVVWYSVFAFFAAVLCVHFIGVLRFQKFLRNLRHISWVFLFVSSARLSPHVLFVLGRSNTLLGFVLISVFFSLYYLLKPGATTISALILCFVLFVWANNRLMFAVINRYVIFFMSIFLVFSLYLLTPIFERFLLVGFQGFGSDNNALWRLMFWVYLFQEKVINYPFFGIGFGSKLFELGVAPDFITTDDGSRFTEYTLGTHNSFVFVLVRLGWFGYLLLVASLINIFVVATKAFKVGSRDEKILIFSLILGNVLFLNSALFNVVLESPIYAGNFWFSLGFMYALSIRVLRGWKS